MDSWRCMARQLAEDMAQLEARAEAAEAALEKHGGAIPAWVEEVRDAALEEAAQAIAHFSCACGRIIRALKSKGTP